MSFSPILANSTLKAQSAHNSASLPPNMSGERTAPALANSPVNLSSIREFARRELIDALSVVRGKKMLVIDPKLAGPLLLVADSILLKENGVEKPAYLGPGPINTDLVNIIYLVRPRMELMKIIAEQIKTHINAGLRKEYSILMVPRRSVICERVLEEEGVYPDLTVSEFKLDLLPFDDDLLSLEMEGTHRECFLDGDRSSLFYLARSIMKLQTAFGVIPLIRGVGPCAKLVKDMVVRMRKEVPAEGLAVNPEIDLVVLIDRDIDLATPLCTQLTYEGLIDEVFGIVNNHVDLDAEIVQANQKGQKEVPKGKKVRLMLNSNDKVFAEMRDLNFAAIGPSLNKKARLIEEYYNKREGVQTITELKDFAKGLGTYQQEATSVRIHSNIAEQLLNTTRSVEFHRKLEAEQYLLAGTDDDIPAEYIEDCINKKDPLLKVLRLLCLYSITHNGMKAKQHEAFKSDIIQAYGYEYSFALQNLEKLGLFRKTENPHGTPFPELRKGLNLLPTSYGSDQNPTDIAYTYSGFAPASVRLVENALRRDSWAATAKTVPSIFEETQPIDPSLKSAANAKSESGSPERNQLALVVFVGGITFAEISAIRFLSHIYPGYDMLIATTKILNGDQIIQSAVMDAVDQLKKPLEKTPQGSSSSFAVRPH